jgi:hypothetical protein
MNFTFTEKDKLQISKKNISEDQINQQIKDFMHGFPFINLVRAATEDDGIVKFHEAKVNELVNYFDTEKQKFELLKFVPASGAASRMFKDLFEFVQTFDGSPESIQKLENGSDYNSIGYFFEHINSFAFYNELCEVIKSKGFEINDLLANKRYDEIIRILLFDDGLGYGNLPKALLRFHAYPDGNRLAVEEHLVEAANYCTDENNIAKVHFTISPEHKSKFEESIHKVLSKYEDAFKVKYEITYSEQKPSTDTIAVDMDNHPFRNDDQTLLFRPGGHGALIENLNDLEEEIIFIKNIDNIVPDHLRDQTYRYKKAIGGLLMKLQIQTYEYLDLLDDGFVTKDEIVEIRNFAHTKLMIYIPDSFDALSEIEQVESLYLLLNRPMRICGMVKNEGEPGGGPFWVKNSKGDISLQIVESSQMDLKKENQMNIVTHATHFNPVDLVCGVYNFRGEKFNLKDFIDHETGFISVKSKDGRDIKALELPGLWNGAMADWITVFVETPIITFNPVKTVNDLLRPQHQ